MFRLFLLSIFSIGLWFNTYGQSQFKLTGSISNADTKTRVALATVTNLKSGISVGSNDMGLFEIMAAEGDSLFIEKFNYSPLYVLINSQQSLNVHIKPTMQLNEVVIRGKTRQAELKELSKDFKNKGSFYKGKPPILAYFFQPLTALYELIGATPRHARNFGRMQERELQNLHTDQLFNKEIIAEQTGLNGKELENFLVKYRPTYAQSENWNRYDALSWINASYKKFKLERDSVNTSLQLNR